MRNNKSVEPQLITQDENETELEFLVPPKENRGVSIKENLGDDGINQRYGSKPQGDTSLKVSTKAVIITNAIEVWEHWEVTVSNSTGVYLNT